MLVKRLGLMWKHHGLGMFSAWQACLAATRPWGPAVVRALQGGRPQPGTVSGPQGLCVVWAAWLAGGRTNVPSHASSHESAM